MNAPTINYHGIEHHLIFDALHNQTDGTAYFFADDDGLVSILRYNWSYSRATNRCDVSVEQMYLPRFVFEKISQTEVM
ncbi:hypothetical protein [Effusibacillus pohliae]|uniref:hypothetical protein n=1 Tax=Effusibacillus pohliae TaxID=232270 RepID=UPI0003811B5F|nr:hypothetical protein [Effusibacillus pohliae]